MKVLKVFIVDTNFQYDEMFEQYLWKMANSVQEADLVQFTGGEDVSPELYNQEKHPTTFNNPFRDKHEHLVFNLALRLNKPMAGICRGGQFLNVMCGGEMYQDVDNHCRSHQAFDTRTNEKVLVTSTHHQMMIPGPEAQIILTAKESMKKVKCGAPDSRTTYLFRYDGKDTEAVFYPAFRSFCFQPHPEFEPATLGRVYMNYLAEFFHFKM